MKSPLWMKRMAGCFLLLFLLSISLFCVFETFPELPRRLGLSLIHYYPLQDLISDPELIFRFKPNHRFQGTFLGDHYYLFSKNPTTPTPYSAHYDEEGFRNVGKPLQADILILGDSLVQYGVHEEDTLSARLEKISGLKTVNYGMEWYGPFHYLEVLKKFGLKRQPKIVFFGFFEGNDLRDLRQSLNWKENGTYYHFDPRPKNFLQRYCIAMQDLVLASVKLIARRWDPRQVEFRLGQKTFLTALVYPSDFRSSEEILETNEMRQLEFILKEFQSLGEKNDFIPVFVFIPSGSHIVMPFVNATTFKGGASALALQIENRNNLKKALEKLNKNLGLAWIDLSEDFEKATSEGKMIYFPWDTHWTAEGRQLAAEILNAFLKELPTSQESHSF